MNESTDKQVDAFFKAKPCIDNMGWIICSRCDEHLNPEFYLPEFQELLRLEKVKTGGLEVQVSMMRRVVEAAKAMRDIELSPISKGEQVFKDLVNALSALEAKEKESA